MQTSPCWRHSGEQLEFYLDPQKKLYRNRQKAAASGNWIRLLDLDSLAPGEGLKLCYWLAGHYPFMPSFSSNHTAPLSLPKRYLKNTFQKEITLFAGSFNPWHEGHDVSLSLCPDSSILVIPDSNPWKEATTFACPFHYFQQLAIHLETTPYSIYPGFIGIPEGNPTAHWIEGITIPKKKLLMGADSFLQMHRWKDIHKVLKALVKIWICPRQGASLEECRQQMKRFKKIKPQLSLALLPHHPWEQQSSTYLRSK